MYLDRIELRLNELLFIDDKNNYVNIAMNYSTLLPPGKRIRPILFLLVTQDLGFTTIHQGIIDIACAIEIIHNASLIIDDMPCMDNTMTRRNHQAIHSKFGENIAILAAVALLSKAFTIIATARKLSYNIRNKIIIELSNAIGLQGLVKGQFKDITEEQKISKIDTILITNKFKTSSLFCALMQIASIITNSSIDIQKKLHLFSLNLGQAFQLLDDLIDYTPNNSNYNSKNTNIITLVNILGKKEVEKRLRNHLKLANKYLQSACTKTFSAQTFIQSWFKKKLDIVN